MTDLYLIVRIRAQGYGLMSVAEYAAVPEAMRGHVEILAVCPTQEKARWIFQHLPQGWRGAHPGVAQRMAAIERLVRVRDQRGGR